MHRCLLIAFSREKSLEGETRWLLARQKPQIVNVERPVLCLRGVYGTSQAEEVGPGGPGL